MTVALRTPRLILRLAMQDDIPEILRYLNDNRGFLAPFEPIQPVDFHTKKYWREAVIRGFQQFQQGQALRLFLFEKTAPNRVIGTANFTNFIYHPFYCCSLGYGLSHDRTGQGLMHEALSEGVRYVFAEMRCHRIQANYMPRNQRSGNVLKRLGFEIEGQAKQYLLINGQWEDHVLTSLTNSHWSL